MRQLNPVLMVDLKLDYELAKQVGSPLLQCQGMLVPRGFPHMRILFQSYPRPMATNNDIADAPYAGGLQGHVAGVPKTSFQGSISIMETEAGACTAFSEFVLANGGSIDCDYYDGRIDRFTRSYEMLDCAFTFDAPDMSADGRSQVTIVSGSIQYMYFGIFADIGSSGTIQAGQRVLAGSQDFLDRVQGVLNATQAGLNLANQAVNLGNQIGGLLG